MLKRLTFNITEYFTIPYWTKSIGYYITETSDNTLMSLTEYLFPNLDIGEVGTINVFDGQHIINQVVAKIISIDDNTYTIEYYI